MKAYFDAIVAKIAIVGALPSAVLPGTYSAGIGQCLCVALPDRLTVGQQPLKLYILVRFQVWQRCTQTAYECSKYATSP